MDSERRAESSRSSGLTARGVVFLALLVPVWGIGVVRGERITAYIGQVQPFFAEDLARFELLRPQLAGTDLAFLLLDRTDALRAAERFFPAQYVLAPTVLRQALEVESVVGPTWAGESLTIVCLFDNPALQDAALVKLEAAARKRALPFEMRPLEAHLALVRIGLRDSR